jgi:hypothetical protein
MITKVRVKEYIQSGYHSGKMTSEKIEAISKASSKFINKYRATHWVGAHFFEDVINACLEQYSVEKDLSTFLEREKHQLVGKKIK